MTVNRITKFAIAYKRKGWPPIPVPYRKKGPTIKGWKRLRLTEPEIIEHFRDESINLGVLLGEPSGIIDVDLDCPESRQLAAHLLPPTGMRFGRNGSVNSHWIYGAEVNGQRTSMFKGPDGESLLELRANGSQTLFPPSTHPNGDEIGFESKDDPAHVDLPKLLEAVHELAAASLLLRCYPSQGSRHDYALAIAGGLLRAGWDAARVERFIGAIVVAADDEEAEDRVAAVGTTQRAVSEGREVVGWPSLSRLIDGGEPRQQYVARVRRFLGIDRSQAIVVRAAAPPSIELEPASDEPYTSGEASMRALHQMADTSRKVRETGNDLAVQVSIWLDRKGPEKISQKISHPNSYASAALQVSVSYLLKLGQIGRVIRCLPLGDINLTVSKKAFLPLSRLLGSKSDLIPTALETAHKLAKDDADREGRTKARPVRPKHTAAAVDEILGPSVPKPAPKPPVQSRRADVGPHFEACEGVRKQIFALADAIALLPTIPNDMREAIEKLARHAWCRP